MIPSRKRRKNKGIDCKTPHSFFASDEVKDSIKRRLMHRIQARSHGLYFWIQLKRVFVSTLVVSMVLLSVYIQPWGFLNQVRYTKASSVTYMEIEDGSAFIKKVWKNDFRRMDDREILHIGDRIRTGKNTHASIYFFDQSIVRLAPNTEILIKKLDKNPQIKKSGIVTFKIITGTIWNKVIQVKDNFSNFIIETQNSVISTDENAVFYVKIDKDSATEEISSIDRSVDISIVVKENKKVLAKTTINEGYKATIKKPGVERSQVTFTDLASIEPFKIDTIDNTWIAENMEKDIYYVKALVAETVESLTLEQEALDQKIQEQSQNSSSYLYNLIKAEKLFKESITLLNNGHNQLAIKHLDEFKILMNTLVTQSQHDEKLQNTIRNQITKLHSLIVAVPPDLEIFKVKEVIREVEEIATVDKNAKQEKIAMNTLMHLQTAKDLLKQGKVEKAKHYLGVYNEKLSRKNIGFEDTSASNENFEKMTKTKIVMLSSSLPILENMAKKTDDKGMQDMIITSKEEINEYLVQIDKQNEEVHVDTLPLKKEIIATTKKARNIVAKTSVPIKQELTVEEIKKKKAEERKFKVIEEKGEDIIYKINLYRTYKGRQNAIKVLMQEINKKRRYSPYKEEILEYIVNKVPIEVRHHVKDELQD